MNFMESDGGKSLSKRPKQRDSCTVIALALASEITYDQAYEICRDKGRRSSRGFYMDWLQWTMVNKKLFSKTYVNRNIDMNIYAFCENNPKGTFIIHIKKHVYVVKDGTAYDHTKPDGDMNITCFIEVTKATRKKIAAYNYKDELKLLKVRAKERKWVKNFSATHCI